MVGTRDIKIVKLVSVFAIRFLLDLDTREVLLQKIATEHSGFIF